jgi:TonB family protein
MFGEGVTLNVTGRVARGLGNDWYAVARNEQTIFVRQQDVVAGSGAPPAPDVREREEEEDEEEDTAKPDEEDEDIFAEFPEPPSSGLSLGDVNWIREPNARDFARYYPEDALDEGQSGRVVLDCIVASNGRLNCSIADESPSGYGFGEAAIRISRQARIHPMLPDGSSAAGRHLRLPLSFRAG